MSKLATVILDLIARVDQATKPRNPELEFGTRETFNRTWELILNPESGTPIKIPVD